VNLDGSAVLSAPPDRVWAVLTDPAVLARTIPGCESLEKTGDDEYRMNVSVGVGAIRGTYAGEVRLSDQKPHSSYVMHASGAGAPGNVRATVTIHLAPSGGSTEVTYSADAVVGGPVAGVGQRMMTGVAKRMAGQFFTAVDAELSGAAVAVVAAPAEQPQPAAVGGPAQASTAPVPQVFAGKAPAAAGETLDLRSFLLGAASGGFFTAVGVALGWLLGRRR
jgi:uncharacterized protein